MLKRIALVIALILVAVGLSALLPSVRVFDVSAAATTHQAGLVIGPLLHAHAQPLGDTIMDPEGFVYISWALLRGAINILLVVALLVISFSNILRVNIDTYTVKKALPGLVIGVILSNASFFIIRYMLDIASVATAIFFNLAGQTSFSGLLAKALGNIGVNIIYFTRGLATPLIIVFLLITLVGLMWLALILYIRLVAIYLLAILSPLAFLSYGIPGFDKYFKQWWQQFVKWLFMVPALAAMLWILYEVNLHSSGVASSSPPKDGGGASLTLLILNYVLFFFALTVPSKLGGSIVDKATANFKKYSGTDATKKWTGEQAKDLGRWAGSHVAERTGITRLQEWNKLRKENFEKSLADRRSRAATRAASGRVGLRSRELALDEEETKLADDIQRLGHDRVARMNEERGIRLAGLTDDKKIIELGVDAQKEAEEREAMQRDNRMARKYHAELEKQQAEAWKNSTYSRGQYEYFNDDNNQDFLRSVFEDVNEADQVQGALKRSEGIMKGNLGREELILAKHAKDYDTLSAIATDKTRSRTDRRRAISRMREIKLDYDTIVATNAGHDFFGHRTIAEAATSIRNNDADGEIIKAKISQASKATDAGVASTIEEQLKTQTLQEAMDEYREIDRANRDKLVAGETMGVSMKDHHTFASHVQKLLAWSRDRNDYRRDGALAELADMHFSSGAGPITVDGQTFLTRGDVENFLADPNTRADQKTKVLTEIAKDNRFLVGSGSLKAGHVQLP